jgi:hypothetical protein
VTCRDTAGGGDGLAQGEAVLITLKVHVKSTAVTRLSTQAEADPTNAVTPEFSN